MAILPERFRASPMSGLTVSPTSMGIRSMSSTVPRWRCCLILGWEDGATTIGSTVGVVLLQGCVNGWTVSIPPAVGCRHRAGSTEEDQDVPSLVVAPAGQDLADHQVARTLLVRLDVQDQAACLAVRVPAVLRDGRA